MNWIILIIVIWLIFKGIKAGIKAITFLIQIMLLLILLKACLG